MIDYATPVLGRDSATLERGLERGFDQTIEQRATNGGCLRRADLRRHTSPRRAPRLASLVDSTIFDTSTSTLLH